LAREIVGNNLEVEQMPPKDPSLLVADGIQRREPPRHGQGAISVIKDDCQHRRQVLFVWCLELRALENTKLVA
jgi:hypothetical protein